MTANNPYLNNDADNDLFEDENEKEEVKKRHVLRGPNGEELPPDLQEKLSEYIDTYWDGMGGSAMRSIPAEFIAVGQLFSLFARYSNFAEHGALTLAIAEVVDELTDGKVTTTHQYHEARRQILYTHSNLVTVNLLLEVLSNATNEGSWHWGEIRLYLEVFGDLMNFIQAKNVSTYRTLAEELGRDVDEQFIESGVSSVRTTKEAITLGHLAADDHVD